MSCLAVGGLLIATAGGVFMHISTTNHHLLNMVAPSLARLRTVHGDDAHCSSRDSRCSSPSSGDHGSHVLSEQPDLQFDFEWNRRRHRRQHDSHQILDLCGSF